MTDVAGAERLMQRGGFVSRVKPDWPCLFWLCRFGLSRSNCDLFVEMMGAFNSLSYHVPSTAFLIAYYSIVFPLTIRGTTEALAMLPFQTESSSDAGCF